MGKLRRHTKRAGTIASFSSALTALKQQSSATGSDHHRHKSITAMRKMGGSVLQRKKSYNLQALKGLSGNYLQSGTFEAMG